METKANYALIGLFILLAFVAAIGFVAWLSNAQFDQKFQRYEVVFTGAVRGLSQGGEVRYNGLRVGEVTRLRLDPGNSNTVVADIEVDANTPVHTNSYAKLEPQGLTGLSYIQIFSGGDEFPLLTDLGDGPYQIPGEMSEIDAIIDGGGTVLQEASRVLTRMNATLSPEAVDDLQQILANTNVITEKLAATELDPQTIQRTLDSISTAAADVSSTLETYDKLGNDVRQLVERDVADVLEQLEGVMVTANSALSSYDALAGDGQELVVDARDAINRLSNSGLTDLEETTDSLRALVGSLNRIAVQLEQNPLQFVVGEDRKTVEIPQ